MQLYLVFGHDAYEINLTMAGFSIVRYRNCHDSRGEAVQFDDLDPRLQQQILERIRSTQWKEVADDELSAE